MIASAKPSLTLSPAAPRRYPVPATPDGWYVVCRTEELPTGRVKPVHYFNRELVLFRGEDRKARAFDPYCPHLGTHLGYGGRVEGNEIVCPYHGWRFDGDGRVTRVPMADRVPRARLRCWPTCEANGLVFVYHHRRGDEPDYSIPVLDEFVSSRWCKYQEITLRTTGHVLELQENLLDETHFVTIHRSDAPVAWSFEPRGRTAVATATARYTVGPFSREFDLRAELCGPGFTVLRTRGLMDNTVLSMGTPIDDDESFYRLLFMSRAPMNVRPIGSLVNFLLRVYARRDFLREARIWERRAYPVRPVYSSRDRAIPKFRRWYQQFWSRGDAGDPGADTAFSDPASPGCVS